MSVRTPISDSAVFNARSSSRVTKLSRPLFRPTSTIMPLKRVVTSEVWLWFDVSPAINAAESSWDPRRGERPSAQNGGGSDPHTRRTAGHPRAQRAVAEAAQPQCRRRSEEHTSELQSHVNLVCRLLLEKKKKQ